MNMAGIQDSKPTIAFLLVVHSNPEQINCFIRQLLTYRNSYVYIHVDSKHKEIASSILGNDRVHILPTNYDVQWGDYSQIIVNNYLMEFAFSLRHHDYYSLHSGADMLIQPMDNFVNYLQSSSCYAYYEATSLPNGWQYGGGLGRICLNWPVFFRRRLSAHSPLRYLRSIYGRMYGAGLLKGKQPPKGYQFFGGADWFTASADCVKDLLGYINKNPEYDRIFFNSLSGAEIYYVTLFEMLKGSRTVTSNNMLRYVDWKPRGQKLAAGSPNTCTMDFLDDIEASKKFFARKFNTYIDSEIVEYFIKKTRAYE